MCGENGKAGKIHLFGEFLWQCVTPTEIYHDIVWQGGKSEGCFNEGDRKRSIGVLESVGTFQVFSDNAFVNTEFSNITGVVQEKGFTDIICQQNVVFLKKEPFSGKICLKRVVNKNN